MSRPPLPPAPPPTPPPELRARILETVARTEATRTPVKKRVLAAVMFTPLIAVMVVRGRELLYGRPLVRVDFASEPCLDVWLRFASVFALAVGTTAIAVRAGQRGLGSSARALAMAAGIAAPAYALLVLVNPLEATDPASCAATAALSPLGTPCAIVATLVGVFTLAALTYALRGAVPVAPRLRGATLGAAAGAWAGLALFVHCPSHATLHLVLGHVTPVAAFALVGSLIASRLLRP